jgi:PIN domain nuclease of toxin-antitoxin system
MIVMDTHVIIWQVLNNQKITARARKAIQQANANGQVLASEISFWEIAMLMKKRRLKIDADYLSFMDLLRRAYAYQFLGITPEIAHVSVNLPDEISRDPADRIICATAIVSDAALITADKNLRASSAVKTIW